MTILSSGARVLLKVIGVRAIKVTGDSFIIHKLEYYKLSPSV